MTLFQNSEDRNSEEEFSEDENNIKNLKDTFSNSVTRYLRIRKTCLYALKKKNSVDMLMCLKNVCVCVEEGDNKIKEIYSR